MFKAGLWGVVVAVGIGVQGCGRLDELLDDLAHHGEGRPDGGGGAGCPDGGGGAVCPFTGCAATEPAAGTTLRSVWIAGTGEVWSAGDAGLVGRRSGAGAWCWCAQPSATRLNDVWGSADGDVWIVGDAGVVMHWNGGVFESVPGVAGGQRLSGVSGTGAADVWAVGDAGTIRHFDGTSWAAVDADSAYTLNDVWTSDPANVWVVGSNPTVDAPTGLRGSEAIALRRTGTGWMKNVAFAQGYGFASLYGIDGISPTDIWAAGVNQPAGAAAGFGGAAHFDGTGWSVPATPSDFFIDSELSGVAAGTPDAPEGAWMVGGVQAIRTDGKGTWTKSDNPLVGGLRAVDARGTAMFAVGPNLTVARWTGTDWTADFGPVPAP